MKNRYLRGFLGLAFSALTVLSLSSCGSESDNSTAANPNSGDVVYYTTEPTTKKGLFSKKKDEPPKEDERVFSADKNWFAVKNTVKDEPGSYLIDVYEAQNNSLRIELIPKHSNFTSFKWDENETRIIVYCGDTAVESFRYNTKEDRWSKDRT